MEPKLPASNLGHERTPAFYGERMPAVPSPETSVERVPERQERGRDGGISAPPILPPVAMPAPQFVSPLSPAAPSLNSDAQLSDTPLVANDDDLIEKEWVDKAKSIIASTKDDPYRRELEVGRLQADYLRKRYGKELGTPQ